MAARDQPICGVEELRRRATEQSAVARLVLRALEGGRLQPIMEDAARVVAGVMEVDLVSVGEVLPGGSEVLLRAGFGWRPGVVGHETEPVSVGTQPSCCLLGAEPVVSDDLSVERRFGVAPFVSAHRAQSAAAVVIGNLQAPFGVLSALATQAHRFTADDVSFMQEVATVLAAVRERSRQGVPERPAGDAWQLGSLSDTRTESIRILLVSDHVALREALAVAFSSEPGLRVAGEAASLAEARRTLHEGDVAVIDLPLGDDDGGKLIRNLRSTRGRRRWC